MRLNYQFQLIQAIRNFFVAKSFIDVMTPPMVSNPGMEVHIHPFRVTSHYQYNKSEYFLHTSPEFHMKELLSLDEEKLDRIFNISYCFRDEPTSEVHRPQFIMLEWYRKNEHYTQIMKDCSELISFCYQSLKELNIPMNERLREINFQEISMQDLFLKYVNFDILNFLNPNDLERKIRMDFKNVPLPNQKLHWDDLFFLLFLNEVEPHLKKYPYLLIKEFPAPLAALSTLKPRDPRVCERFEIYLEGVELCNCFNELIDLKEQKKRFTQQRDEKEKLYHYCLPEPNVLYQSLERGLKPSSGIAMGVERLFKILTQVENPFYF